MPEVMTETQTIYRLLSAEEWDKVRPVFERYGTEPPSPSVAPIAVAERDGEIIGFLTLQPMLHAEPLYIAEGRTKDVYIPRLLHTLEEFIQGLLQSVGIPGQPVDFYVFSDSAETGRLAKSQGFEHMPYHVWRKRVGGA